MLLSQFFIDVKNCEKQTEWLIDSSYHITADMMAKPRATSLRSYLMLSLNGGLRAETCSGFFV